MYGELQWKPWDLLKATWAQVMLAIEGLREKDYYFESIMRRVAAAVVGSGTNKKLANSFNTSFWPDARRKIRKKDNRALDQLRRFKVMEAQKKVSNG